MVEHRHGNTESRARGAVKAGCEVQWVEPYWTDGIGPVSKRIQFRARTGPAIADWNGRIIEYAKWFKPEVVWVESPLFVYPQTYDDLRKKYGATIVCAYSDDPRDPKKKSRNFEDSKHLFDLIFTTKDQLAQELLSGGARAVAKFWKGYDPRRIRPGSHAGNALPSHLVFIGHPDFVKGKSARLPFLEALASEVDRLRVFGKSWAAADPSPELKLRITASQLDGEDYASMISQSRLALQIPSRLAQDTHSSRSVEIPACGAMMIAERTTDHQMLFEEDREAVFFSSVEELVSKSKYYLEHDDQRNRIALAGLDRCNRSGYSNESRMVEMLREVERVRKGMWC